MTRGFAALGLIAMGVLIAFAGLTGCDNNKPAGAASDKDGPILIGHYGSLTGAQATFGQNSSGGIRLAIKEFNAAGGLNGRKIELKEYDTKGDAREAGVVVTRLVTSDRVKAVLGEVASGLSLAGAPVCQENSVPMISPSSTNPRVTLVGNMIFRVCFIDTFQGYVCAKFAAENRGAKRIAILYDQAAPYSVGLAEEFRKNFTRMGGTITTEQTYTEGDQDFTAQLTTLRGSGPDIIFVPGYYTDVGNIALQARKLGITTPLLGGDGWTSPRLAEIAGPAIEGSFYCDHYSPDDPSPAIRGFINRYKAEYDKSPDSMAALGYDAAMLLFDAMKRARSLDGPDLAAAIAATKDFPGVTGTITINAERNAVKPAVIVEFKNGKPTFVTTVNPS